MKIKPVVLYSRKTDPEQMACNAIREVEKTGSAFVYDARVPDTMRWIWNNTHASRLNIVSAIRENQAGYMVTVK